MNIERPTGDATLKGRKAVLVVEDEPMLLMTAVDMVEEAGFEAVEATDATEAVRLLEKRLDICVIFTDIDMPRGMDGMRLASLVRDRWPPVEIIVTSGRYDVDAVQLPSRAVFFSKPYRHSEIVAAIRKMTH